MPSADQPTSPEPTTEPSPNTPLGWRAWGIAFDSDGPVLTGRQWMYAALGEHATYPTMPARAYCAYTEFDPDHIPPSPGCKCGLYFTWDRFTVENVVFPNPFNRGAKVLGQIVPSDPIRTVAHDEEGVPDEQRTGSLVLAGEQLVSPAVPAETIAGLAARYGIEFIPSPDLLRRPIDPMEEFAHALFAQAQEMAVACGMDPDKLPFASTFRQRRWNKTTWNPPSKAEQMQRRSPEAP